MFSVKQIFLILSILSLASAAEKGVSARKPNADAETRRGLKKSKSSSSSSKKGTSSGGGYVAPNRGGGVGGIVGGSPNVGGINRDGTPPGQLIQPTGKACVAFNEAKVWLTADYPGDVQCRVETGQMGTTSGCCRIFSFTDTNGPQKWLLYDSNNQYRDLMCVCNENTPGNSGSTPVTGGGTSNNPVIPGVPGTPNRGGDVGASIGQPNAPPTPATPPTPALPPVAAPATSGGPAGVCDVPNPTQAALRDSPYMVPCEDSSPCGNNKCCFSNYCVCWPVSQLVPGTSYCL